MINVKSLSIALSLLILILVFEFIRRERLSFKYAFSWIAVALLALIFAVFDKFLYKISVFLGFTLPSNFIFFVCFFAVACLSLLLTIFLCQQNERNDRMAQKLSILENEIDTLKKANQDKA